MAAAYGYAGRILKVDVTGGTFIEVPTAGYADRFIGGRGIAAKIYWDEVLPEVSALAPENRLIFVTGPLAGFRGLAGSRWQVCGKSPAITPEHFSYSNLGGSWGAWLKFAGYDALSISGASPNPVCLFIHDGKAELRDASHLWGKGAIETRSAIKNELGQDVRVAAIGPAGESMAVMANVIADEDSSGSGGFGAVMGSKRLKAVAVRADNKKVTAADPGRLSELVRHARALKKDSRFIFSGPHRMWSAYVPQNMKLNPKLKKSVCYGCISGCVRSTYTADDGRRGKYLCVAAVFYADPSKKMGQLDDTHFHAARLCNEYGLDVFAIGAMVGWLMKCVRAGVVDEEMVGLPLAKLGSLEFIQALTNKIATREGFGDALARGLVSAAAELGPGAQEQLAGWISYKTGTGYPYEPRIYITTGLFFATEPRLPMAQLHEVIFPVHLWWDWENNIEGAYFNHDTLRSVAVKFLGGEAALDFSTYRGKALAARIIQDRVYVKECLNLCDFAWPMMDVRHSKDHVGDPELPSKVYSAVTGRQMGERELYRIGERVFNLQRAILVREGHNGREADSIPEFDFTLPLQENPGLNARSSVPGKGGEAVYRAGQVIDREKFEKMKDQYYRLRGWDPESGLQKRQTLKDLGLEDIIEPLKDKVI